ncbi:AraC family transcriptional regulator [Bacteroides nordii]|nr:AraC family transcriptional regulator [Bacteroides nordii]
MSMDNIVNLESVDRYNSMYGLETLHPLVSVVDLTKATKIINHTQMNYGVYALFLKQTKSCDLKYGRRSYDYQEGTIVCFAPGQTVRVDMIENEITPEVYGIVFHPDLIRGTSLGKSIKNYTFFSYAVNEALHISDQEKEIVMDCLKKISIELEHAIDKHSKALIAMNIELLLNYCMRFYERQFITRSDANKDALTKFEQLLNEYFLSKLPMQEGLPSVKYFADKICLSSNYFGDMVKKETGKTPQEHIQDKVIEMAKEHIAETDETVSQIAYTLGFQYPQHLCRLFKKRVGCTPNEYRTQQGQII